MKFFKKKKPEQPRFDAELAPEVPFYAIGDIHGSDQALQKLLTKLDEIAHSDAVLVCVGDYVDRGEQSADVLRRLHAMQKEHPDHMTCLMGNHEHMMLKFLDNPTRHGSRWLRYGGLQTLASFGVGGLPGVNGTDQEWSRLRDAFQEQLGEELETWLRDLPTTWMTGNVCVIHAGADPMLPLTSQEKATCLWGHPDFNKINRTDGNWVVHGHTIVDAAQAKEGKISVDTGAYATGHLTAALVEKGKVSFIST